MTLQELKSEWADTPEFHKAIHEYFFNEVNGDPKLKAHRDFVEQNIFGMGERSFWWLWKLICEELPKNPKLLEIGVFKAATMSLWKMLRPDAICYGITPLDGRGTGWTEDDYAAHIKNIHNRFELEQPKLIIGGSEEPEMARSAGENEYSVVYVDGNHSEEGAYFDLVNYSPMVKSGGWLVVDDAACRFNMPFGYFQGIDTVCSALQNWELNDLNNEFEFQFNVVHIMCYKRK